MLPFKLRVSPSNIWMFVFQSLWNSARMSAVARSALRQDGGRIVPFKIWTALCSISLVSCMLGVNMIMAGILYRGLSTKQCFIVNCYRADYNIILESKPNTTSDNYLQVRTNTVQIRM